MKLYTSILSERVGNVRQNEARTNENKVNNAGRLETVIKQLNYSMSTNSTERK